MSDYPFSPSVLVVSAFDDIRVRHWEWHDSGRLDVELVVSFGDLDVALYLIETGDGDVELLNSSIVGGSPDE